MEKRGPRRAYRKGNAFKENKVSIRNESRIRSQKPKKNDPHVTVESPEFQLLVKLYVPAQLLITNNRVSLKQLKVYLPVLVNESYPDLNLELHLFLSTIVTSYVSSWYLSKLNTDNTDFVVDVYTALSDFVRDFSRKVSTVAESPKLLVMINELAAILNQHIRDNHRVGGVPNYAWTYLRTDLNNVSTYTDTESLKRRYLATSHIVFQNKFDSLNDQTEAVRTMDPEKLYYRAIALEILNATFGDGTESAQGSQDSEIVTNLLSIILADLVFEKLLELLSSPKFVLHDVLTTIFTKMNKEMDVSSEVNEPKSNLLHSLGGQVSNAIKVVSLVLSKKPTKSESRPSVFYSPVLSLLDTITRFSKARSVLSHVLSLIRTSLYLKSGLAEKIEEYLVTLIMTKIRTSSLLQDGFLANTVAQLRTVIFDRNKPSKPQEQELTTAELADLIYSTVTSKAQKNTLLGATIHSLAYKGAGPTQAKDEIRGFLDIFAADYTDSKSSDTNKLLAVKLLDCIIRHVYPSLTEEVSI